MAKLLAEPTVRMAQKKPVVVEAFQLQGNTPLAYLRNLGFEFDGKSAIIPTLEGNMKASPGDWIIKGVEGEYYPCKDDIFRKTYDLVGYRNG